MAERGGGHEWRPVEGLGEGVEGAVGGIGFQRGWRRWSGWKRMDWEAGMSQRRGRPVREELQ
ncbi:unnamed protein product [Staurois parvus]|uniref:Uncharacterized protein n=1 Tax=Staurois parvus TaxID=386267 RepID=A0ABN9AAT4_9NEOB|nr:unnamed protein product [Staurois parvus]